MTTYTSPTSTGKTTSESARNGLSPWVAGAFVTAVLAAGGWGVWKFWTGSQMRSGGLVVATDEPPSAYRQTSWADRMRVQAINQMNAPDYVRERNRQQGGGWEVKGNRTRLIVQRGSNNQLRLTAESMDPNFITAEQRSLLALRARAGSEDAVARQLNVTPEQRERLNAIPRGANYPIDPPTRENLSRLFLAWEAAPADQRQPHADALIAAVRQLETAQAEATRRSVADRVAQIREIVSPEQIRAFEEMGRGGR